MPYSLYLHIPYCTGRCNYCDFYTAAHKGGVPAAYVSALLRDFARFAPAGQRPATVYFGGGTPGLLTPGQVAEILAAVNPAPGAEVTLETNPGLLDEAALRAMRTAGVNRLSVGVQTAQDASLRRLGRRHTAAQAGQTLAAARAAGFENITADIMLALPGYTNQEFDDTLRLIAGGDTTHISAYLLKCEPGTPFGDAPPAGLPTADEAAAFYAYAVEQLAAAGYAQYEISNFARPGFAGQHNLVYWNCGDYLGLGPGAHSCLSGRRFSFGRDTAAFIAGTQPQTPEGKADAQDYIMLQLRLAAGLNETELARRYGLQLTAKQVALLGRLAQQGLAKQTVVGWALTPAGMLVQNSVLTALLG